MYEEKPPLCLCVCARAHVRACLCMHAGAYRGPKGSGVTGQWKLPGSGARNHIQVLWHSRKVSEPLSHLSSVFCFESSLVLPFPGIFLHQLSLYVENALESHNVPCEVESIYFPQMEIWLWKSHIVQQ